MQEAKKQEGARPSKEERIRQGAEKLKQLTLLSDTFASVVLQDIGACEHVVRTILGRDDIHILEVIPQHRLLNITAKDSILDVHAQDDAGRQINIEIQRKDTLDHAKRTRYYSAMLDKGLLEKGAAYHELAEVYIIYISETDIWGTGKVVTPVVKTLGPGGLPYDDGSHVIYVNAQIDDGSAVAKLMQYFKTSDPEDFSQGALSERVHYLKSEKKGDKQMCAVAEELFKWGVESGMEEGKLAKAKAMAQSMYADGLPVDTIAKYANVNAEQISAWLELH